MLDNQLIQLFLPIIKHGLIANGLTNVSVKQAYQPTQQGVNTNATVYFFKVSDHRYGWVGRVNTWNADTGQMIYTETQNYETTFQINALVIQDPKTPNQYTASDLVNTVAQIMQSASTVQTLIDSDVGIYRITDIRNPYFMDDKDRFEASPSFDFTLTHKQISQTITPVISSTKLDIFPI